MSIPLKEDKNTIPHPGIVFLKPFSTNLSNPPKKLVISTNKKIFKTAVARNSAKRRVREAYRLSIKNLKHDTLHPLPFLRIDAREGILKMKIDEIQNLIQTQLSNKLLNKK